MDIFRENIDSDCSNKIISIDCEIDSFDERKFLENNLEDIIKEWFEKYKYKDLPVFDFENCYLCNDEIVSRNNTSLNIYIPLLGDYDSLKYKPFHSCLMCYNYETNIDEKNWALLMKVNFANHVDIDIDSIIESTIAKRRINIETQYKNLGEDLIFYNREIFNHLKNVFSVLFDKVQIKIEIQNKTKKSKYLKIVPKKTEIIKIERKTIETVKKGENIVIDDEKVFLLAKESYFEIYNNIKELSLYAQRLPRSYYVLNEEENRDQLINALNLKLKTATATGETFNVKGKCDIVIIDNKVIYYIAECKIWHGPSELKKAIDQLLSYISNDIFYSSLIIFNKNKQDICSICGETIKTHDNFIKKIENDRFSFKHPNNPNFELEISLIIFNICYK